MRYVTLILLTDQINSTPRSIFIEIGCDILPPFSLCLCINTILFTILSLGVAATPLICTHLCALVRNLYVSAIAHNIRGMTSISSLALQ